MLCIIRHCWEYANNITEKKIRNVVSHSDLQVIYLMIPYSIMLVIRYLQLNKPRVSYFFIIITNYVTIFNFFSKPLSCMQNAAR